MIATYKLKKANIQATKDKMAAGSRCHFYLCSKFSEAAVITRVDSSFLLQERQEALARKSEGTANSLGLKVVEREVSVDLMLGRRIIDGQDEQALELHTGRGCVRRAHHRGLQNLGGVRYNSRE